jgi:outer membrane receptor protein involved in Fe transport
MFNRIGTLALVLSFSLVTGTRPGDLVDPRIPAGGTPGFVSFHLRGGFDIGHASRMTVAVQNLTDQTYRTHGSGIDQPGRSPVVGCEWSF